MFGVDFHPKPGLSVRTQAKEDSAITAQHPISLVCALFIRGDHGHFYGDMLTREDIHICKVSKGHRGIRTHDVATDEGYGKPGRPWASPYIFEYPGLYEPRVDVKLGSVLWGFISEFCPQASRAAAAAT